MWERLAPWPLTTTVDAPGAALAVAVRVSTEDWPDCTVAGLKEALTPAGRPEAVSVTDWALPVVTVVPTVVVTEAPCWTVPEDGLSDIEKSLF